MNKVFRSEKKYFMPKLQAEILCSRLSTIMMQDSHNGFDGYFIRSLYFDTLDDRDFWDKENGINLRRKIRLRIYDTSSSCAMLEIKQKEGSNQLKRSLKISRDEANMLIGGNPDFLLTYPEEFARECYALLKKDGYRPKIIIDYKRKAFIARENHIRITFDHNLYATEANFNLFSDKLAMTPILMPSRSVLEVKYNGFLLQYLKDLLCEVDKSETSVSKYNLSRKGFLID